MGWRAAPPNQIDRRQEVVSSSLVYSYQHQSHRVSKSGIAQQSA